MLLDSHADTRPDEQPEAQAYGLPPTLACGLACARMDIRCDTHPATRAATYPDAQNLPQGCFCEKGLSALQINVLALAYRAGARVTPYGRIARRLAAEFGMSQQAESVRGAVNRLAARGFLRHQQARDGTTGSKEKSHGDLPPDGEIRCMGNSVVRVQLGTWTLAYDEGLLADLAILLSRLMALLTLFPLHPAWSMVPQRYVRV